MAEAAKAPLPSSKSEEIHRDRRVAFANGCAGRSPPSAKNQQPRRRKPCPVPTLTDLCRNVINTHLERYPPDAFSIIDLDEWQSIVKLRCASTRPKNATEGGGLDGTGRLVPCVSDKSIAAVELANPDFAECSIVDDLLWKPCVEFKFKRNGLTRPQALFLPWPLLVSELQQAVDRLVSSGANQQDKQSALNTLRSSPMNVALLKDSGVGKSVKKAIKKCDDARIKSHLEELLASWMEMAANNGVCTKGSAAAANNPTASSSTTDKDLKLAESCQSWRELFTALKNRNEKVLQSKGKLMREKRQNLANSRPKLVKVRPASAKQVRVLEKAAKLSPSGNSKITQLRTETMVQTSRISKQKTKASFGDAVAFASVSSKGSAHKRKKLGGTVQSLGGGKQMKVPNRGPARGALAKKFKTSK